MPSQVRPHLFAQVYLAQPPLVPLKGGLLKFITELQVPKFIVLWQVELFPEPSASQ
jgi:hypothetical protein